MSSLESGGKGSDVEQHSKATYKALETSPGEWKMGAMPVDPTQGFKAKEIQLLSFQRPHMRAFHFAWSSFFVHAPRPPPRNAARATDPDRPTASPPPARRWPSCAGSPSRRSWCSCART